MHSLQIFRKLAVNRCLCAVATKFLQPAYALSDRSAGVSGMTGSTMKVDGKVAVITGGAQGLGKGFAKILLKNKAKVLLADFKEDLGTATLKELQKEFGDANVLFFKADVKDDVQMEEMFQHTKAAFGRLDIVVNNAGIGVTHKKDAQWENCVDTDFKGPIRCTRMAMNYLRKDKGGNGGVIVNVSSLGGLSPQPWEPVYSAAKSGLVMFSRSIAANPEIVQNGVRINTLCPGFADTQMVSRIETATSVNKNEVMERVNQYGIMPVDYVAEGFYELLTDEGNNGAVLAMSKTMGKKFYIPFRD